MPKVLAIFHDASVGLEFMTQDLAEAEEIRQQLLTYECVAEVRGWTAMGQPVIAGLLPPVRRAG